MDNRPASQISQSQLQLVLEWNTTQPYSYEALTCANAFDALDLSFLTQLQIITLIPNHGSRLLES